MSKKLYIHIGGLKTGSTALQIFFAKNRPALEAQGFCYPGTGAAHWDICSGIDTRSPRGKSGSRSTSVKKYLAEIRNSSCHTAILSGECLSFQGGAEALREFIPPTLPVMIVYYARRQDALVESFYHERVKSRHHHIKNRLDEEFLDDDSVRNLCDHAHVIRSWADSFGKENVIVRCYERQQMQGDIIGDFSSVIGLSPDGSFTPQIRQSNSRMDPPHSEFIRLCNNAFPDSEKISKFLFANRCHRSRLFENRTKQPLLSPETRLAFLGRYEDSNRAVARDYLGRADGHLFYEPWPDPDEQWVLPAGLTTDELSLIIDELITSTGREHQRMEPLHSLAVRLNKAVKLFAGIVPGPVRRAIARIADPPDR